MQPLKLYKTLSLALLILTLIFSLLWQYEYRDNSDVKLLAQNAVYSSHDSFTDYKNTAEETDYLKAISEFYAFKQAYRLMSELEDNNNYSYQNLQLDEIYGGMLFDRKTTDEQLDNIITATSKLSKNITDIQAFVIIERLRNEYNH